MFVKFKYHAGYTGTEGERIYYFDEEEAEAYDDNIDILIEDLASDLCFHNADSYAYLYVKDKDNEEEFDAYYNSCEVTWEILDYEPTEYTEYY